MTRANEIMQHLDRDAKITIDYLEEQIVAAINHAISKDKAFILDMQGVWSSINDLRTMIDSSRYEIGKEE